MIPMILNYTVMNTCSYYCNAISRIVMGWNGFDALISDYLKRLLQYLYVLITVLFNISVLVSLKCNWVLLKRSKFLKGKATPKCGGQ